MESPVEERGGRLPLSDPKLSTGRFPGLDGLRGLAALSVFILHAVDLVPESRVPSRIIDSPLHVFFDGTAAVDLFFVLSGFVLALPFVGNVAQPVRFGNFVARRIFRLYPAYWLAIGVAIWFRGAVYSPEGLGSVSSWGRHFWALPLTTADVLRHALMIGPSFDTNTIDPVVWSLITEMRMSLLFPLVLFGLRRVKSWRRGMFAVAASVAVSIGSPLVHVHTFTYLPMFVLGGVIAAFRAPLLAWAANLRRGTAVLFGVAALLLYDVRFALFGFRFNYYAADLVIAAASAVLLVLVAGRPTWSAWLATRPVHFLGRISYSFYLLHLPILLLVSSWLYPVCPSLFVCCAVGFVTSLVASEMAVRFVELPFHAAGKNAAALVDGILDRVVQLRTRPVLSAAQSIKRAT